MAYKLDLNPNKDKNRMLKILVLALEFLAVGLIIYIVVLPFYPALKYKVVYEGQAGLPESADREVIKEQVADFRNHLPDSAYDVSPNRVIIPKIGVNAPIVVTQNSDYGLSLGSWLVPDTSTPDKGGNTVLTGHRFKYLPPNNLTFYLLDKLAPGDLVSVVWKDNDYLYKVRELKVVDPTEVSILNPTSAPVLTLYTCTPIYSTAQRLVVISDLIETTKHEEI